LLIPAIAQHGVTALIPPGSHVAYANLRAMLRYASTVPSQLGSVAAHSRHPEFRRRLDADNGRMQSFAIAARVIAAVSCDNVPIASRCRMRILWSTFLFCACAQSSTGPSSLCSVTIRSATAPVVLDADVKCT
jgi:hypothetical protein